MSAVAAPAIEVPSWRARCRGQLTALLLAAVTFGATTAWHEVATSATKAYWDRYVVGLDGRCR